MVGGGGEEKDGKKKKMLQLQQQGHRSLFIEKSKSWSYEARFGKDNAGGMEKQNKVLAPKM